MHLAQTIEWHILQKYSISFSLCFKQNTFILSSKIGGYIFTSFSTSIYSFGGGLVKKSSLGSGGFEPNLKLSIFIILSFVTNS